MGEPVNYEAVLADLRAKKAQIETAIAAIEMISATTGGGGNPTGGGGGGGGVTVGSGDYLGMSIPEAAKKHLASVRKKLSTQDIMHALEAGGLPASKYNTVYSILRRRERQVGDIINMQGDWALAQWYPNHRKRVKEGGDKEGDDAEYEMPQEEEATTA
jgi:hypothetical protein